MIFIEQVAIGVDWSFRRMWSRPLPCDGYRRSERKPHRDIRGRKRVWLTEAQAQNERVEVIFLLPLPQHRGTSPAAETPLLERR